MLTNVSTLNFFFRIHTCNLLKILEFFLVIFFLNNCLFLGLFYIYTLYFMLWNVHSLNLWSKLLFQREMCRVSVNKHLCIFTQIIQAFFFPTTKFTILIKSKTFFVWCFLLIHKKFKCHKQLGNCDYFSMPQAAGNCDYFSIIPLLPFYWDYCPFFFPFFVFFWSPITN